MNKVMQIPSGLRNVPLWEKRCRKIHARARDVVAGKMGIIEAAQEFHTLAMLTQAKHDADLSVFTNLLNNLIGLPIGRERPYWSKSALEREDRKIRAIEQRWSAAAMASAHRLVEKYQWALAARDHRRQGGRTGP